MSLNQQVTAEFSTCTPSAPPAADLFIQTSRPSELRPVSRPPVEGAPLPLVLDEGQSGHDGIMEEWAKSSYNSFPVDSGGVEQDGDCHFSP
jgi:hypothetical protein